MTPMEQAADSHSFIPLHPKFMMGPERIPSALVRLVVRPQGTLWVTNCVRSLCHMHSFFTPMAIFGWLVGMYQPSVILPPNVLLMQ